MCFWTAFVEDTIFRESHSRAKQAAALRHKSNCLLMLVLLSPTSSSSAWPQSKSKGLMPITFSSHCLKRKFLHGNYHVSLPLTSFYTLGPFMDAFLERFLASQCKKTYSLWKQNKLTRNGRRRATKGVHISSPREKLAHSIRAPCILTSHAGRPLSIPSPLQERHTLLWSYSTNTFPS